MTTSTCSALKGRPFLVRLERADRDAHKPRTGRLLALGRPAAPVARDLPRHRTHQWKRLDPDNHLNSYGEEDKQEDELSVQKGFRILSAYGQESSRLWIITEADRSVTTILWPDEY